LISPTNAARDALMRIASSSSVDVTMMGRMADSPMAIFNVG
jgi:hypothetical protein